MPLGLFKNFQLSILNFQFSTPNSLGRTEQEDDKLCGENAEEHAERIDRAVAYGRGVVSRRLCGVSQSGRVRRRAGNEAHKREIVQLVADAGDDADDEDGQDRDEEAAPNIGQTITGHDGVHERGTGLNTDTGKEEDKAYFTQHQVGTGRRIGHKTGFVAEAADEDGNDERTTGQTELDGRGNAGQGNGQRTEDNADKDADEDGGEVGMVEALHRVAHHVGHAVDGILGTDDDNLVAHLHAEVAVGIEVHAVATDASHVDAVHRTEMQRAELLAVHAGLRNEDVLADEGNVLLLPFNEAGLTNEGGDGLSIVLGADDIHLIAIVQHGVAVGDGNMAFVEDAGNDEVAAEELTDLKERPPVQSAVFHAERHLVGLGVGILGPFLLDLFLFLVELHATEEADGDGGQNDTHDAQRIGTGIAVGNWGSVGTEDGGTGFVGGTEAGRVRDGTAKHTDHHGQVVGVLALDGSALVEDKEEEGDAADDVQQNDGNGQHIHLDAGFLQALEEAGPHLEADAVDEEDEPEVLHVGQDFRRAREVEMSGQNAGKEHKGDAERNAEDFDASQRDAQRDDGGVEQHDVGYRVGVGEKID